MRRDEERLTAIVETFLRANHLSEPFSIVHPPNEDVYLVRFHNERIDDIEIKIPLDSDIERSLQQRLEVALRHLM